MHVDAKDLSGKLRYFWMISSIVPRPIAWVSTISSTGVANLAPFSYFNGVCSNPPILSIAVGRRRNGEPKDTHRNAEATRELVVNLVPEEQAQKMVETSIDWPPDRSEFEAAGLTMHASDLVRPPRVMESSLSMECRLHQVVPVGDTVLLLAEILRFHAKDSILTDGMPDPAKLKPVSRLGGNLYATLGSVFELKAGGSGG